MANLVADMQGRPELPADVILHVGELLKYMREAGVDLLEVNHSGCLRVTIFSHRYLWGPQERVEMLHELRSQLEWRDNAETVS